MLLTSTDDNDNADDNDDDSLNHSLNRSYSCSHEDMMISLFVQRQKVQSKKI